MTEREFNYDLNYRSLPNDVRHLEISIPSAKTSACVALVKTGSRNEVTEKEFGLHHLTEHVVYRGTKNFPNYNAWTKAVDGIEAEHDADAEKEYTKYYVFGSSEHTSKALLLVSELLRPTFPSYATRKEKTYIVKQEFPEYSDSIDEEFVSDFFESFLFEGTPLANNGLGSESSVQALTRRDLRRLVEKWYRGANVLIVTAGNIGKIRGLVEEHFGSLAPGPAIPYVGSSGYGEPGKRVFTTNKTDRVHFMLGVPGVSRVGEMYYPLQVISAMLGGSESTGSSRLYQAIQVKNGQAYRLTTKMKAMNDVGYIAAQGAINPRLIGPVLDTIRKQMFNLVQTATKEEVKLAKAFLRGRLKRDFESTLKVAEDVGLPALIFDRVETPSQMIKGINSVRLDDVRRVAEEFLKPELERLVIVGPVNENLKKVGRLSPR